MILYFAITRGDLACVELLIPHRDPSEHYLHAPRTCEDLHATPTGHENPMAPNQLRCLQLLFDKGCQIHPGTVISAARFGDVDFLRFLHARGVPLWTYAWQEWTKDDWFCLMPPRCVCRLYDHAQEGTFPIPYPPEDATYMRKALMYGVVHGAPVPPLMKAVLQAQRSATRAVLLSFHVAARLSAGEGTQGQKADWAVMGRVPIELIEEMLLLAELEVTESVRRPLERLIT
jgi:hypothetical protein